MSPTHPWPSSVGYTTYGYIILLVYIIWKYNLLKLIFFDNVEVYFYIEVGLSTSNEESKGETLRHMTWAKAHLMVVGGLILGKGIYGPLLNSEALFARNRIHNCCAMIPES